MMKRVFAIFLTCVFLLGLLPTSALAAESDSGGLCPHHQEHSYEICGYMESVEDQPCGHIHDGVCGYVEAEEEIPCNMDCAETGEDGQIIHGEGCVYAPAAGNLCQHEHDAGCGYAEAVEGRPCGYVCRICPVQALIDDLPPSESITADNRTWVETQLEAIDKARAGLTDAEAGQLDNSRYQAVVSALSALDGQSGVDVPVPTAEQTVEYLWCDSSGQNWTTKSVTAIEVTTNDATNGWGGSEVDKEYWYVVNSDVEFAQRVTVTGDVHLILANGCNLTVNGGIQVQDNDDVVDNGSPNGLTIYAQSTDENTMGKLNANGSADWNAGIGGTYTNKNTPSTAGKITINGGYIIATGGTNSSYGYGGAGIGGGRRGAGGTITINSGMVEAVGGSGPDGGGTGIGGGESGGGGTIIITGGVVTATAGTPVPIVILAALASAVALTPQAAALSKLPAVL